MKKINNNGFGKIELITVLGLIAILLAVGSKMALDTSKNYNGFKTVANTFANAVSKYKDYYTNNSNIYYLNEVIEKGYSSEIKNPMEPAENCDKYNSFVEIPQPNNKKITLICGNYIVEAVQDKFYNVYEITEWTEKKESDSNDSELLFNYKKDGNLVFDEYLTEEEFIEEYFEKNNVKLTLPSDINDEEGLELVTKIVYRTKTLVKEIK